MFARYRLGFFLTVLTVTTVSCNKGEVRTGVQIQYDKMDESIAAYGVHHEQMVDNAMLHNMALVDHHFVAHTAELSGTGATALDRMTPYLAAYGGTVRYESYNPSAELIAERIDHIREYLTIIGCNMDRIDVQHMMSGGRGLAARDAIDIKMQGTATAGAQGAPTGAMPAPASGGQGAP